MVTFLGFLVGIWLLVKKVYMRKQAGRISSYLGMSNSYWIFWHVGCDWRVFYPGLIIPFCWFIFVFVSCCCCCCCYFTTALHSCLCRHAHSGMLASAKWLLGIEGPRLTKLLEVNRVGDIAGLPCVVDLYDFSGCINFCLEGLEKEEIETFTYTIDVFNIKFGHEC